jgi:hypothetical protein
MNWLVVTVLATFFATAGAASGQSLAEFARKERERRSNVPDVPVINNEALRSTRSEQPAQPTAPTPEPETPAAAGQASKTPPAEGSSTEKPETKDEAWWRAAFAKARQDAERADVDVRVLEIKVANAEKEFLLRDDVFNKEGQMVPLINQLKADLEAARGRATQARQKIADLEEELRRSGGLPGWAR